MMIVVLVTMAVISLMMLMGFGMIAATCMFVGRPISEPLNEREELTMLPHAVQYIER